MSVARGNDRADARAPGRCRVRAGAALLLGAVSGPALSQQPPYRPPAPTDSARAAPPAAVPPGIGPRLAEAGERALRTYPAIAAAQTNIRAAGHDVRAARWLRFPSVSIQAVTRDDRVGAISPEVEIVQPIWTGGRIAGTIDRARALRAVAEARLDETALDILLRLSAAYYDIARTARLESLYEESLAEHRRLVESMERRVAQEVSPRTDLELARARAAQVEQELNLVTAQHDSAMQRFLELVGDPQFALGIVPLYVPAEHHPPAQNAVERALACHPAIRRLTAEVAVAEADRRVSRAAILPQLGMQYSYDRFRGSQMGLAVRAQTNGGLSPFAAADAATARRQASELQVAVAQRELREAVALDLVENGSARTRITSSAAAAQSTANVTDSFLRQFVAGRRTWLDVMNAVREAIAARAALTEVETSAMASSARIHLRTCEWRPASDAAGQP